MSLSAKSTKPTALQALLHLWLTNPVLDGVEGSTQLVQVSVCAVTGQFFDVYAVLIKLVGVRDITSLDCLASDLEVQLQLKLLVRSSDVQLRSDLVAW